jgi:uncharacterized membrane protein
MENVNRKIIGAFAGVLAAVALTHLNMWQLAIVVLLGIAGYLLSGIGIELKRRIGEMMRRRRE